MKNKFMKTMSWMLIFSITLPAGVFAQGSNTIISPVFRQEELAQMLAPIALYPDPLLVQMLMAATYPLEVVEAARWTNANQNLKGDQLASVLEQKGWDPSVKSLVNFPNALAMMDGNLEWTQKLGDAFLAQKDEVMDTIQYLRSKAQNQGNLRTTAEQVVRYNDQAISIEPANQDVMYVPVYDPAVAYGSWWYPDYPPYYYYPPGYVLGSALAFGAGLFLGAAWWGWAWGGFDWYHHGVYCNPYRYGDGYGYGYNHYNRHGHGSQPGSGGHREWMHDPSHRRNVDYRGENVRERYGRATRPITDGRNDFSGRLQDGRTTRARTGEGSNMEQRRDIPGRDGAAYNRRMTGPTNNRAVPEQRMIPPVTGRTPTNKMQDDAVVVERLGTHQGRDTVRPGTQPPRTPTASGYGRTMRPPYQGQETTNSSFRNPGAVNPSGRNGMMGPPQRMETTRPSNHGGSTMRPSQRVEATRPSSQGGGFQRVETMNPSSRQGGGIFSGGGRGGSSGVERGGFSGGKGSVGGFSGRTGGSGGRFSGRAGGSGGKG